MNSNKELQFSDIISRIYSKDNVVVNSIDNNSMLTADVTFQVTDACNLCCSYCY